MLTLSRMYPTLYPSFFLFMQNNVDLRLYCFFLISFSNHNCDRECKSLALCQVAFHFLYFFFHVNTGEKQSLIKNRNENKKPDSFQDNTHVAKSRIDTQKQKRQLDSCKLC